MSLERIRFYSMIDDHAYFSLELPPTAIRYRSAADVIEHLGTQPGVQVEVIGASRNGQPIAGYCMGSGPMPVSITAGCHADEPVGPMTAQALPWLVRQHAPHLLDQFTFRVVPQINPDGADNNRRWFSDSPDFPTYVRHAIREAPGDDVEFGFAAEEDARPECRAAIPFLWEQDKVVAHFSLHGMAWAEGAWYLLCAPWVSRSEPLMGRLTRITETAGLGFHEIDRGGAKGFTRIREGFATTPSSVAMRRFFEGQDDQEMAAKFLPSSMEMALETGDDPLCMVSEIPLFLLDVPPSLEDPVLFRFRDALAEVQATGRNDLAGLMKDFNVRTLPIATHIRLQFAMMVAALEHVADYRGLPSR